MDIYPEDHATVVVEASTNDGSGGRVAPSVAFAAADIKIIRDDGTVKSSVNGITASSPINSQVGCHRWTIDTSNDTGDASFWTAGHAFSVWLYPASTTVDGQSVSAKLKEFWLGPPADSAGVTSLLARIPSALFSGITSLAHWLGAMAGKQAANGTAQTEIRATGAGSGTYDPTTDSQEAIRDRGDAAWATAAGFATSAALAATEAKIDTLTTDLATTDGKVDDIKAQTDVLEFEDGAVKSNVLRVNDVLIVGDGSDGNPWKAG